MAAPVSSRYRSATEYRFREDQADAIARTASYHRKDFCRAVIWFPPREHAGIRPSIATPFPRTPAAGLGALDRLPLELLHDVLSRLDMRSLFRLRQANLRSRQAVDSLHQYQKAVSHGLNLFCALMRTRLADGVSLLDFYHALCTKACALCGEFAGFVSLLAWERCCFACLQEAPETQVRTLASIRKQFHLTKAELGQLRSFKTLPGIYSMEESVHRARITVVSVHQVASISRQPRVAAAQADPAKWERSQKFNFMGSCALPHYDRQTGKVEYGMSCAGCQLALERYIIGSMGERWASDARERVYALGSFLEHFQWCQQAQILWESSDEGRRRPAELPEAVRRGGFFNRRE